MTGANYLLDNGQSKILVDCGLRQGLRYCEPVNFKPFLYEPNSIEAVFITHAHIDHIGRLPLLYKKRFRGKVYSTPPTKDFAHELLLDSEKILSFEAKDCGEEKMYGLEEVEGLMSLWETAAYRQILKANGFEIEFYNAGHILGSSSILITEVKSGKRIVFSGDLGNPDTLFLQPADKISQADYALIESTYGGRIHENRQGRKRKQLEGRSNGAEGLRLAVVPRPPIP